MFNRSVNKVVLVGNLGKDPEVRYMPNGNAVANFSIATTESWKNKQTGEYENQTEWHNLTVFGKFGEMCGQYLKKGAKVYVEGKIKTDKFQDKTSGQDRYSTKIIVSELQMMDASNNDQGGGQQRQQRQEPQQHQQRQEPQQRQQNQQRQEPARQQRQEPQPQPAYQPTTQQTTQSWGNAPANHSPAQQQAPQQRPAPQQRQGNQGGQQQAPAQYNEPSMDFDDDIPF